MFEKLAKTPSRSRSRSSIEIPLTAAFLTCVRDQGYRLSYGALAEAANQLGEDTSRQIRAQRGSTLTKTLPSGLQPYVCRKAGGYAKGVTWDVETPADLRDRPVLTITDVAGAIEIYEAAKAKAAEAAKTADDAS